MLVQDNFYFYTPDGQKFYSKIKGWAYAQQTNQPLLLYYYDHIWEKLDWKIEPTESLEYYYKAQAQRIRDEYDYVILCYSGGADSTNILETFHYNNIKLDKIVMVGAMSQDSHSMVDENHNGELYHNCFPYLKQLGLESISEVIDYTKYFDDIKNFSIYQYGDEWIFEQNSFYSVHNWFWRDFEKYVVPQQYADKKVAIIFGKDKPWLRYDVGGRYFSFWDKGCLSYFTNPNKISNIERINFYWDPNYPFIVQKQLFVLYDTIFTHNTDGDIKGDHFVYNLKNPLRFKSGKSQNSFISLRDNFMIEKQNNDIFKFLNMGMEKAEKIIGDDLNMPTIYTRKYYVS